MTKTCRLCGKPISDYTERFNTLPLDEESSVDLCQACIDKFLRWQQERFAKLFPTAAIKKRFEKRRD